MSLSVDQLKKLPESSCFQASGGMQEAVMGFLMTHEGTAYTVKEVLAVLNEKNVKSDSLYTSNVRKATVAAILGRLKGNLNNGIHKKGSYYYYEKELEEGQ